MEIKDIIKNRRIELGLTLKDIADAVGVSEATVSRWESGEIANMRRDRIFALAKKLDISPLVIMGLEEPQDLTMHDQVVELSKELTPAERENLINYIKHVLLPCRDL